jgi:arylsulfatase
VAAYSYYLNMLRDNDDKLAAVLDAMDEMDPWKDTSVVVTADHGEMGGAHGGLRGKGPFAYEQNAHVPLVIVHPDHGRATSDVLTSHLDLLPTLVAFAGAGGAEVVPGLPGHDLSPAFASGADVHAVRSGRCSTSSPL